MTSKDSSLGFFDKYGIKYYTFLIQIFIYVTVFQLTHSMELVLLIVLIIPKLGIFLPEDSQQKSNKNSEYNKNFLHMLAPALYVFCTYFIFYYTWSNYDKISHSYQSLISCMLALPFTVGQSIDGCHELIHRNQFPLKAIGFLGLVPFQFTTYPVQHLYMHHKKVGSLEDDVSSPKNYPIYKYYIKTVSGSYRQTFKYSKVFFLFCMILNFSYLITIYLFSVQKFQGNQQKALRVTIYFFLVAYLSLFIMECVQYIQHYGLIYRKNGDQKPVLQICSWNTVVNPLYNWMTFRFQRHSDHHMNAYKIYSSMELNDKMPLYPFTFADAISLCWFPSIWYKAINPLVDRVMNNEKFKEQQINNAKSAINLVGNTLFLVFCVNAIWANYFADYGVQLQNSL